MINTKIEKPKKETQIQTNTLILSQNHTAGTFTKDLNNRERAQRSTKRERELRSNDERERDEAASF